MKRLSIFLMIISFSCKKEEVVQTEKAEIIFSQIPLDTIKPHAYLPVYPGSWWKYVNEKGITVSYTTEPVYVKDFYTYFSLSDSKVYSSHPSFVPVYMGRKIWGRFENKDTRYPYGHSVQLVPIVSDSLALGKLWPTYYSGNHNVYNSKVIHKDTAIVISGKTYSPTIVLQLTQSDATMRYFPYANEYYTKDIGMVRSERFMLLNPDSIVSYLNLVDYHVNK